MGSEFELEMGSAEAGVVEGVEDVEGEDALLTVGFVAMVRWDWG